MKSIIFLIIPASFSLFLFTNYEISLQPFLVLFYFFQFIPLFNEFRRFCNRELARVINFQKL